jgi:DNA repair exonuclease SbcCD ATPase subunit
MIKLKTVEYKNLQAVGNHPIKIQLDRWPTTMLAGHNGSGKSTVLESLAYGFFNKPLKKIKLAGLINSTNQKGLLVTIEFDKGGNSYKVVRGQKPNIFEIWVNDELQDQSASARDYQAKLEYILGMDYKLFTQVVVLNKVKYVPFMDLDAGDRRKVVEDLLNISVFSYMNGIVKEDAKAAASSVSDITWKREQLANKIASTKQLIVEAESKDSSLGSMIVAAIEEKQNQMKEYEGSVQRITAAVEEQHNIRSKVDKERKKGNECDKVKATLEYKIKEHAKALSFFTDNTVCPTCSQSISNETINEKKHECDTAIATLRSNIAKVEELYPAITKELKQQEEALQAVTAQVAELSLASSQLDRLRADVVKLKAKLLTTKQESKTDEYKTALLNYENEYAKLTDELDEAIKLNDRYNICKDLLKDTGIKASIISDYIEFINTKVNDYLQAMEFHICIRLDENFNETIGSINKKGFTYDNLSTGQQTRVNMAIWLALLEVASIKNSVVTNVLFLDEILEALDVEGVSMFMGLVREKLPHKNVFVVTQRQEEFADYFKSEIKFKLNQGFTEMLV